MSESKRIFERHVNRETAVNLLSSFKKERPWDWQNVTVNFYANHPAPYYITFGCYQSGATANFNGDEFLRGLDLKASEVNND